MNFLTKVIVAFFTLGVLFFAVLLAVIGFTGIQAKDQSMHAVYSYNLDITTSKPLHNATLLIPVPCSYDDQSEEWRTFLNLSEATLQNFDTGNNSMRIESKNGCKYLNVSAKIILPVYKNHIEPIPIYPGQNESELPPTPTTIYSHICSNETPVQISMKLHNYFIKKDGEIDTKHPFEKERKGRRVLQQGFFRRGDK